MSAHLKSRVDMSTDGCRGGWSCVEEVNYIYPAEKDDVMSLSITVISGCDRVDYLPSHGAEHDFACMHVYMQTVSY
jgi:hypothetical protein